MQSGAGHVTAMPQVTAVCDLVCKSPGLWSPPSGTLDLNFWIAFVFFFSFFLLFLLFLGARWPG